jgi:ABC-type branched-subunit amino acid transport system ATPase component
MGLSLTPQGKEVFAAMSVEENLLMGAYHRRRERKAIAEAILGLRELGLTLLLVEQNVGMALDIADYIYVIRGGGIAYEREVGEGVGMDELQEFYLGGREHG